MQKSMAASSTNGLPRNQQNLINWIRGQEHRYRLKQFNMETFQEAGVSLKLAKARKSLLRYDMPEKLRETNLELLDGMLMMHANAAKSFVEEEGELRNRMLRLEGSILVGGGAFTSLVGAADLIAANIIKSIPASIDHAFEFVAAGCVLLGAYAAKVGMKKRRLAREAAKLPECLESKDGSWYLRLQQVKK